MADDVTDSDISVVTTRKTDETADGSSECDSLVSLRFICDHFRCRIVVHVASDCSKTGPAITVSGAAGWTWEPRSCTTPPTAWLCAARHDCLLTLFFTPRVAVIVGLLNEVFLLGTRVKQRPLPCDLVTGNQLRAKGLGMFLFWKN
jgi:hypothetical protein